MRNWSKESIRPLIQSRTTEMKVNGQFLLSNRRRRVCSTCEWEGPLETSSWGHLCSRRTPGTQPQVSSYLVLNQARTSVQVLARLTFKLLNPCVQPWHLCSFCTISSRTIWQGKIELGSVQLEEVGWHCSAPFSHGGDTQCPVVSEAGQPNKETSAPFNPDWSCKQWHGEGACSVVLLP